MLVELFWITLVAGGSGAVVIWVFAVRLALALAATRKAGAGAYVAALIWPFGAGKAPGVPAESAIRLNKMLVALFIALLVAISSMAVYSNLTFVPPALTQ